MSIGTTRRTRKPRLKVVGGDRRPPRHRVVFGQWPECAVMEFFSHDEWDALAPWERPKDAVLLPGCGWLDRFAAKPETREEFDEIVDEYIAAVHAWQDRGALRGNGRCGD